MTDQISTIILRVDLDCHQCYKKIRKILCNLQDQERIRTISFDTNNNAVIIDGPFDPHKLSCKIRCKGGKVIKGVQIMGDGKPEQMAGPPPSNSRKKKSKSKGKGKESPPPPAEQPPAYHPQPPTEQPQTYYPQPPTEQPPAYHHQPPTEQPPEYQPQQPTEQQAAYHPQPPAEQPPEYHPQQPPPDREISATMPVVREEERPKERPAELETPKEMPVHFVPESAAECHKNPRERHRHPMGEMPSWNGPPMVEIPSLPARPVGPCRCMCCASCYQGYYGSCRCSDCGRTYGYTAGVALPPPAGCYSGARTPYCGGYSGYRVICEEDQAAACTIM